MDYREIDPLISESVLLHTRTFDVKFGTVNKNFKLTKENVDSIEIIRDFFIDLALKRTENFGHMQVEELQEEIKIKKSVLCRIMNLCVSYKISSSTRDAMGRRIPIFRWNHPLEIILGCQILLTIAGRK